MPMVRGLAIEYENWGQGVYTLNEFLNDLADWKAPTEELYAMLPPMREFFGILDVVLGAVAKGLESVKEYPKGISDAVNEAIGILSYLGNYSKAAAYAASVINTAQAVTKALSAYPPPVSFVMAALQAAAGAVEIGVISKTSVPSAEEGAFVPKPTLVEAGHGPLGEVILPLDRAPLERLSTERSPITSHGEFHITVHQIIKAQNLDDYAIERAGSQIFTVVDREMRRRGFNLIK